MLETWKVSQCDVGQWDYGQTRVPLAGRARTGNVVHRCMLGMRTGFTMDFIEKNLSVMEAMLSPIGLCPLHLENIIVSEGPVSASSNCLSLLKLDMVLSRASVLAADSPSHSPLQCFSLCGNTIFSSPVRTKCSRCRVRTSRSFSWFSSLKHQSRLAQQAVPVTRVSPPKPSHTCQAPVVIQRKFHLCSLF